LDTGTSGEIAMHETTSRRTFVKTAGAAVIGAALAGQPLRAQAGEFTGKFKKAIGYGMIEGDAPAADKFNLLKELGYDGVEVNCSGKTDPQEMLDASKGAGVPIHGVVLGSVDGIEKAVDLAKFYGADSVLLVAGRVNETMPYAQNYTDTQAVIKKAIPYAEEKQVPILVENVWNNFLMSPLEMAKYVDELGNSPFVGAYFDAGNVARYGWAEHWIPVLGKRIKKVHVKDYSRKKQFDEGTWKGFEVELGDGETDWAAVRAELAKIGYTGWVTAEVPGGNRDRLADLAARMNRILDL
jgi:hexulose-6-phosphate isomerase